MKDSIFWLTQKKPTFFREVPLLTQLPHSTKEIALFGRSNAGKSSFINTLASQKRLAKTSGTPGKTKNFTLYQIDENHHLVDLPGYGYAAVARSIKNQWHDQIPNYLSSRTTLIGCVLFMDCRHILTPLDLAFLHYYETTCSEKPILIVLTKADKLSHTAQKASARLLIQQLQNFPNLKYEWLLFSAPKRLGAFEADAWLKKQFT